MSDKSVREVIDEIVKRTEVTWGVYPSSDTILAALKEAGYVVVPKEPTEEMLLNGCN